MRYIITALLLFCAATAQAGVFVGFGEEDVCQGGTDGLIGVSTGYTDSAIVNNGYWIKAITPTEDGEVAYIHVSLGYCNSCTVNAGIYTADGSTKLADGTSTQTGNNSADQTLTFELDTPVCLSAGTTYRLVAMTSGDTAVNARYAGNGTANSARNVSTSPTFGNDLPLTVTNTLDNARNFLIWSDNTQ